MTRMFKCAWGSLLACLMLPACTDQIEAQLDLLLLPLHKGPNVSEDPFVAVDRVELSWMTQDGRLRSFGSFAPEGIFGPSLIDAGEPGVPFLQGFNSNGQPVSAGFGPWLPLRSGDDRVVSLPFQRLNRVVAWYLSPAEAAQADPFRAKPPSLRLDRAFLEKGTSRGDDDISAWVTWLWSNDQLFLEVRVRDDQRVTSGNGQPLSQGDAVEVFTPGDPAEGPPRVYRIAPDGRSELADGPLAFDPLEVLPGEGYRVRARLPLSQAHKNQALAFDLRVIDIDGSDQPTWLTWRFNPAGNEAILAADLGQVVLGAPLMDVLPDRSATPGWSGAKEIRAAMSGRWSNNGLTLEVQVQDNQVILEPSSVGGLEGADRIEIWLDTANDAPAFPNQPTLFRCVISAKGDLLCYRGFTVASMDQAMTFSGTVSARPEAQGYWISLYLPWKDIGMGQRAQRDRFLGLDVVVVDEGDSEVGRAAWSGAAWSADRAIPPACWPELRLYKKE